MKCPTSWKALTPTQLEYVCTLLVSEDYTPHEIAVYTLIRHCLTPEEKTQVDRVFAHGSEEAKRGLRIALASAAQNLLFIATLPTEPVQLPELDGAVAVAPTLDGLPFGDYLRCENLFQGYLHSGNWDALAQMLPLLYRTPDGEPATHLAQPETSAARSSKKGSVTPGRMFSLLLWWSGAKQLLSRMYPRLFVARADTDDFGTDDSPLAEQLREAMNLQIRALTDGDITRETAVLEADTHRALTELEAKVKEAEALKATR